ncbi:MAG: hypothetical protein ACM3N0_01925 [Chloroflexota bacterium]
MAQSEHDPDNASRLPPQVEQFLGAMEIVARGTAANLQESWRRPVRHNKKIERLALWHTVMLGETCERAIDPEHHSLVVTLSPTQAEPETRYEIQAAARMIPGLVPFSRLDQAKLRADTGKYFDKWGEDMAVREPVLVANWHSWLWSNDPIAPYPDNEHGRASLLAIAASRLADNLHAVLSEI